MMGPDQIGPIFLTFFYVTWIPIVIVFYRNRNVHPIKGRSPFLILVIDLCCLIFGLVNCGQVYFPESWPCGITMYGDLLAGAVGLIFLYVYRLLRLLFSFEITKNVMELENQSGEQILQWKENWYTRNRYLINPSWISKVYAIFVLVVLLECTILMSVEPSMRELRSCPDQNSSTPMLIYFVTTVIICCTGFIAMGVLGCLLFSHHADAFSMKAEFRVFFLTCGMCIIAWIVTTLTGSGPQFLASYLLIWTTHIVFYVSTAWPVVLSIQEKKTVAIECEIAKQKLSNLRFILDIPEGFSSFLSYLKTEFSSENLFFWRDVEEYRKLDVTDDVSVRGRYLEIYGKFIREGAPFAVNISDKQSSEARAAVLHLPNTGHLPLEALHIFDNAQVEVYNLMSSDGFARYQRTDSYKAFLQSLKDKHNKGEDIGLCKREGGGGGSSTGSKGSKDSKGSKNSSGLLTSSLGEQIADGKIELAAVKQAAGNSSNNNNSISQGIRSTLIVKNSKSGSSSPSLGPLSRVNSTSGGGDEATTPTAQSIRLNSSSSIDEDGATRDSWKRDKTINIMIQEESNDEDSKNSHHSDAPLLVRRSAEVAGGSGSSYHQSSSMGALGGITPTSQGSPIESSGHHGDLRRLWDSESPRVGGLNSSVTSSPSHTYNETPLLRPSTIHLTGLLETDQEPTEDLLLRNALPLTASTSLSPRSLDLLHVTIEREEDEHVHSPSPSVSSFPPSPMNTNNSSNPPSPHTASSSSSSTTSARSSANTTEGADFYVM